MKSARHVCIMLVAMLAAGASAQQPSGLTAHEPGYADKAFWPKLTGKEEFVRESWPQGRVLVWANPGKSGDARGLDPCDPANWLENGKPATELFDENTDMLLPAADVKYQIDFRNPGHGRQTYRQVFRHVTIEANASFPGGGDGVGKQIHGNVWIKKGGAMSSQGATRLLGDRSTFFRNDNDGPMMCSQYFVYNKDKGKSVEILGHVTMLDEFNIAGCTVIVGVDSKLQPGRNASPVIQGGGTLALLDGAYFGLWANNLDNRDLEVTGNIQGGLPDRPLTRSATLGLNYKNHVKAQLDPEGKREDLKPGSPTYNKKLAHYVNTRAAGMVLYPGSAVRSYSTDLTKARLIVTWNQIKYNKLRPEPGSPQEKAELEREPAKADIFKWSDSIPKAIDVYFSPDTTVDGVEFDCFHAGGLMLGDPALKNGWKNVFFGPSNMVQGDELFMHLEKLQRGGVY